MTTIGFHLGPGGNPTGIGQHWQQLHAAGIPFFVKSTDHYGFCFEAANLARGSNIPHTIVYRLTTGGQGYIYDFDVPPYEFPPVEAAAIHWTRTKAELPPEFDKELVWVELINEIDKGWADWLGHFAAEIGILAMADGYKVTLFGWASGEPESAHWQTPGMKRYLTMCAANPTRLAVSLHEYSYSQNIKDGHPNKVGRFVKLFEACAAMGIGRPTVHLTEWGWEQGTVPPPEEAIPGIDWAYRLYAPYPEIKGVAIWNLAGGWGGIADLAQKLIAPVTEYMLNAPIVPPVDPPPPPPPPVDPPPSGENLLPNASFEGGWWHINGIPELQIANEFETEWIDEEMSPGGWPYVRPEYRVLPAVYLPPEEQQLFVKDGQQTIKIFKGYGAINAVYKSQPFNLDPGRYRLTIPLYPDAVMDYIGNQKVFANPDSADYRVWIDGIEGDWIDPHPYGLWRELVHEFDVAEAGPVRVGVRLRNIYAIKNSGWFTDAWRLERVDDTPPPPPPPPPAPVYLHARLISPANIRRDPSTNNPAITPVAVKEGLELIKVGNVTGQTVSGNNQWIKAVAFVSRPYATDSTPGKVKTNRSVNLRVVPTTVANWPLVLLPAGVEFEYLGNADDLYNDGQWAAVALYVWKPLTMDVAPGIRLGKLLPGTLSVTSPFNAPRSYPFAPTKKQLHEGLDFGVPIGTPVLAGAAGVVDFIRTVDPGFGYGLTVRIKHSDRYTTWLGHLGRVDVTVGQQVTAGQQVALSGNSGGSSGPHLHLTLVDNPGGVDGYVIDNVTDPTLYLHPAVSLLPAPAPPDDSIDLLPYFTPANGQYGDIAILKNNWGEGDERQQLQREGDNLYVTKNSKYELRKLRATTIDLVLDTSPGEENGIDRYYTVSGTWLPRQMAIGQSFTRTELVKFFRKDNCQIYGNPYTSVSDIKLVMRHSVYQPADGIVVNDVIELHWIVNGAVDEKYFYGRGLGLIAWNKADGKRSWIVERVTQGQQENNSREVGCFS